MCQASGCSNRRTDPGKKGFFAIPDPLKDRERCVKWLNNIGTDKFNIQTYVYHKSRVVCEEHFTPDCFKEDIMAKVMGYTPSKKLLKPGTVPTIFLHHQTEKKRFSKKRRRERQEQNEVRNFHTTCSGGSLGGGGGGLGGLTPPPPSLGLPSKNLMCIEKRHHYVQTHTVCS